jgi:hypothetical protein
MGYELMGCGNTFIKDNREEGLAIDDPLRAS